MVEAVVDMEADEVTVVVEEASAIEVDDLADMATEMEVVEEEDMGVVEEVDMVVIEGVVTAAVAMEVANLKPASKRMLCDYGCV